MAGFAACLVVSVQPEIPVMIKRGWFPFRRSVTRPAACLRQPMHIVIRLVILMAAHTLLPASGSKLLMVKRRRFPLRSTMAISHNLPQQHSNAVDHSVVCSCGSSHCYFYLWQLYFCDQMLTASISLFHGIRHNFPLHIDELHLLAFALYDRLYSCSLVRSQAKHA